MTRSLSELASWIVSDDLLIQLDGMRSIVLALFELGCGEEIAWVLAGTADRCHQGKNAQEPAPSHRRNPSDRVALLYRREPVRFQLKPGGKDRKLGIRQLGPRPVLEVERAASDGQSAAGAGPNR